MRSKVAIVIACGAVLALGACNTGGGGFADQTRIDTLERDLEDARAALTAAEEALVRVRDAQRDVVNAPTDPQAQAALRATLTDAENAVREAEMRVAAAPATSATRAVQKALASTRTALASVKELYPASDRTDMDTPLDRARAAVGQAQTDLAAARAALVEAPDDAADRALDEAQSVLTTALVSLLPQVASALDAETARADTEKARADTAEERADTEKARADTAEERADTEKARADAEKARADTYDPRLLVGERLTPLEEQRVTLPPSLASAGAVTFTPRTTSTLAALSATANPNALVIRDEAVAYADGRRLFPDAGGGVVSADEFPLRGIATRGDQLGRLPDRSSDNTINPAVMGSGAGVATWSNYDATYESSIQLRAAGDGMTLKMGGAGTIFYDMEWLTALGPGATQNQPGGGTCANVDDARCDDPTTSDIEATFGQPVADPDGAAAWHFSVPVPVNPATPHTETRSYADLPNWAKFVDDDGRTLYRVSDADGPYRDGAGSYRIERAVHGSADVGTGWEPLEYRRALRIDRGRPVDQQGVYDVKLSNYAGGGGTDDDPHRYLAYAAYGLFKFLDYSTREVHHGRFQAFHFGYDAFRDADGQRPVDWGTATEPVTATFEGRTTGWLLQSQHGGSISDVVRLRGDVTLTANFNGGGDGHGTVQGTMRNFEWLNNDVWGTDTRYKLLQEAPASAGTVYPVAGDPRPGHAVMLKMANVGADGSFSGVAYAAHNSNHDPDGPGPMGPGASRHNFTDGTWGGVFYGPRELGRLEAAGYWRLPAARHGPPVGTAVTSAGTIIGGFGAVSESPAN